MAGTFRVGLTVDLLEPDGSMGFGDIGLDALDRTPGVAWEFLAEDAPETRHLLNRERLALVKPTAYRLGAVRDLSARGGRRRGAGDGRGDRSDSNRPVCASA